jgi:hypothetical protein
MSHRFTFQVSVELDRVQGKFASREDMAYEIQQELEAADPGSISAGEDGEYEVTGWEVEEK